MTTTNMIIWNKVCDSDASALKDAQVSGQKIKSINGTSVFKKATEVFGPLGEGWSYDIIKDEFIQGAPVLNSASAIIANEMMHTIQIQIWYMHNEKKITMPPQYGHTPFVQRTSNGPKTDFDAPKKSLTDAIKKSLSMLGFNADVFLGDWDDVTGAQLQAIQVADKSEKREEKDAKHFETLVDEAKDAIENELPKIKTSRLLTNFKNKWLRKAANEAGLIRRIDAACVTRLEEIQAASAEKRESKPTDNNEEGNNNE
ncbi:exonuclease [Vibrio phage D85]|nr:hypothetical protein PODOV033v1_p0016 [Vibrio phage 252E42.2]